MSNVGLRFTNGNWVEDDASAFWLPSKVKEILDKVKYIKSKDFDAVILIDGMERAGKSLRAINCGQYLSDEQLTINNFCRGLKDTAKKMRELPDGSIIILDEGSQVFGSKDTMAKQVKALLKLMDVVGQKNFVFIICLPSFFDLNRQIAVRRSKFLFTVGVDENYNRGSMTCHGEESKKWLYIKGKKTEDYSASHYDWVVKWDNPWKPLWWDEYKETVKKESLQEAYELALGIEEKKHINEDNLLSFVYKSILVMEASGLSLQDIAERTGLSYDLVKLWKSRYKKATENLDV